MLPLKEQGIDTLVLGCTHYPVLKGVISEVLGEDIKLIDSAEVISGRVYSILKNLGWLSCLKGEREDEFYVTDFPDRFRKVGEIFLERKIEKVTIVDIGTITSTSTPTSAAPGTYSPALE